MFFTKERTKMTIGKVEDNIDYLRKYLLKELRHAGNLDSVQKSKTNKGLVDFLCRIEPRSLFTGEALFFSLRQVMTPIQIMPMPKDYHEEYNFYYCGRLYRGGKRCLNPAGKQEFQFKDKGLITVQQYFNEQKKDHTVKA